MFYSPQGFGDLDITDIPPANNDDSVWGTTAWIWEASL